jgi:hypothetical protein
MDDKKEPRILKWTFMSIVLPAGSFGILYLLGLLSPIAASAALGGVMTVLPETRNPMR